MEKTLKILHPGRFVYDKSALRRACISRQEEVVQILIDARADINDGRTTRISSTPPTLVGGSGYRVHCKVELVAGQGPPGYPLRTEGGSEGFREFSLPTVIMKDHLANRNLRKANGGILYKVKSIW